MATHSVARSKHATLTAATIDTITITATDTGVEVLNRSTAGTIYFTTDGTAPTVAGDNTYVAPPGQAVTIPDAQFYGGAVKLISATADAYSVTAI